MRFNTKQLLVFTTTFAIVLAIGIPVYREMSRPKNCQVVIAASKNIGVNAYTVLDANENVRAVVLEKLTRAPEGKRGRNSEPEWLEYSTWRGNRIHLRINGWPVYFSDHIVVYYAIDGGEPNRIAVPLQSIRAYHDFPHELWNRLIEKNIDEQSGPPKSLVDR